MRHAWAILLVAGCDCLVQGTTTRGTVTSAERPRVWLCAEAPAEDRDPDRVRQCVPGEVTGGDGDWAYTVGHWPGPGGGSSCYRVTVVVFEAEGCARQVVDLAEAAWDSGGGSLDVALDCD